MNTFSKIIATVTFTFAAATAANAAEFVGTDKSVTTKLCLAAADGNRVDMRHAVKDSRLTKSFIVENVKCNDIDILAFAQRYNDKSGAINKYMGADKQESSITITDIVAN